MVVLQQERQRPQSVLAMTLPVTATAHNRRIGLVQSRLWAERFNIHLRRWHMHVPSCSRDRTGSFVRFPDAKTGEAVQYQASKGSVSEYKGVKWRSTANHQHLIILDGPDSGQIDHKVVCEKDVIWVAWLTSSEERVCNMLDCADGIMFDARVSRYRRRLQQSVKKHNAMQHFFADERRGAPISGRRNLRRLSTWPWGSSTSMKGLSTSHWPSTLLKSTFKMTCIVT